jgi:hypothetical protein
MEKACHGMAQYQRNLKDTKKHVNLKQKMKKHVQNTRQDIKKIELTHHNRERE